MPLMDYTAAGAFVKAVQVASEKDRQQGRHIPARTAKTNSRTRRIKRLLHQTLEAVTELRNWARTRASS